MDTEKIEAKAQFEVYLEIIKAIKFTKSEARKEFAERLKETGTKVEGGKGFEGVFVMANNLQIDNLLAEMESERK